MPPKSQFGIQQFDTNRGMTLLGQPSNSRFSQLLSPGRSGSIRSSAFGNPAQAMANQKSIHQRQSAQRAARRAAGIAATRAGGSRTSLGAGISSLGRVSTGYSGPTVTTPRAGGTAAPIGPSAGDIKGLQGLVANYNKSFDTANAANEGRYQQLLGLADQDIGQKMSGKAFENMYSLAGRRGSAEMTRTDNSFRQMLNLTRANTGQRLTDIRSDAFDRGANQQQNLSRLGMGNTTVGTALESGNLRDMQADLNRASDDLSGREIGLLERRQGALNQLSQSDQSRRLGIMGQRQSSLSELAQRAQATKMGVIERRTDAGPSSQSIMDIIAGIGSQYGGGKGISAVLNALGSMRT